jgi:sortase A
MPSVVVSHSKLRLSSILIVTGLLLLGYVSVQYGTMLYQQRKLRQTWAEQQRRTMSPEQASMAVADDGLTRLSIPKLDFSAVVVEGIGRKELLLGPGHMSNTALPGAPGNSVITAHRDTFFRRIVDLAKGDRVVVERGGRSYTYEVAYKKIVKPTDLSVTEPSGDVRLTLVTCYPIYFIGPAPERLVVVAKLVGQPSGASPKYAEATRTRVANVVAPAVAQ